MTACPNRCVLFCKRGHYRTSTSIDKFGNCRACRVRYSLEYSKRCRGQYAKIQRRYRLKHEFGITPEEYVSLAKSQGGKCAGCGVSPTEKCLSVDHDHLTGKVRGLLCSNCNLALGNVKDSVAILKNLMMYLSGSVEVH